MSADEVARHDLSNPTTSEDHRAEDRGRDPGFEAESLGGGAGQGVVPEIELDMASPVPPYEQIRSQVSRMALLGALPPGIRLPSVRQLAGHLGISNGVVARAYRQLEADGVVVTAGRRGTSISATRRQPPNGAAARQRRELLGAAAEQYASEVRRLGYDTDDAHDALAAASAQTVDAAEDVRGRDVRSPSSTDD